MPIPAYIAGTRADRVQSRQSQIDPMSTTLLMDQHAQEERQDGDSLGKQYVLGVFPLTRLQIPFGEQQSLNEAWADFLYSQNHTVIFLRPDTAGDRCSPRIEARFVDLSVNAYDLLFLRRMCVAGSMQVIWHQASRTQVFLEKLDACRFGPYAFSPQLSALLERQTFAAIRKVWVSMKEEPSAKGSTCTSKGGLVLLPLPAIAIRSVDDAIDIAPIRIAHLIQRGLRRSLEARGMSVVSILGRVVPSSWRSQASDVRLDIELVALPGGAIEANVQVVEQATDRVLQRAACPFVHKVDDATLEEAGATLAKQFFGGACRP